MKIKVKQGYTWLTLGVLMILLYIGWYQFSSTVYEAEMYAEGLNYIEYLNSSVQRLVKLEMSGSPNDELVFHLENVMEELDSSDIYKEGFFHNEEAIDILIEDVKQNWDSVDEEIMNVRNGEDSAMLLFASERLYNTTMELSLTTTEKFTESSAKIREIQVFLMMLIAVISLIIFRHLYRTFLALRHTKALTEHMFIDVSTGLYNRSKCQEMLRDSHTPANHKSRIMIIMDLNDLKITNDRLGHQVGDELISSFASILRQATDIHDFDLFVGRYGGDEFMIYYYSAEEVDVKLYLEEVKYLVKKFNEQEKKFQISYAAGYAVFTTEQDTLTMQELFNAADEAMYENKVKMKAEKQGLNPSQIQNQEQQSVIETEEKGGVLDEQEKI